MTMTKLKIDLKSGTLEVEGAELFVKSIYEQFTTQMTSSNGNRAGVSSDQSTSKVVDGEDTKPKKTKKASPEKPTSSNYKPALDKNLDTSKLKEFVNNYELKNHSEKVLVFTKYLESINQIPCNF